MMTKLLPRCNLWVETENDVVLSRWRIELLEAIAETGSISAAAERLRVPYRVAWSKVKEMEHGLGVPLVETRIGGMHGGGAEVTAAGHDFMRRFHELESGLDEWVRQRFLEVFGTQT